MRKIILSIVAVAAACASLPAAAQVVVTGMRQDRSATNAYLTPNVPAIGLTRRADYFVTPLWVSSDSRIAEERESELFAMLEATIARAEAEGITLVAGQYTLTEVTRANMRELPVTGGARPDTSRVQIYARVPLAGNTASARDTGNRIRAFVASIPATGRSFIETGATSLAIDDPEQYRDAVVRQIADASTRYAAMFGDSYGVTVSGLDGELYWQQASETEVFLYIEHAFAIAPR